MVNACPSQTSGTEDKPVLAPEIKNEILNVGDAILFRGDEVPFIGKIARFEPPCEGYLRVGTEVYVERYYRPEETCGRREFHGKKEVFRSSHIQAIQAEAVLQKCGIHTLSEYRALEEKADYDFFFRFSFDPINKKFYPEVVPLYCKCEMPCNPDKYMVMCGDCENWYHPGCVGLTRKRIEQDHREEEYHCPECKHTKKPKKKKVKKKEGKASPA